jgi:tRNA(fMet)-specific endonuclease VapC
MRWMLDTDICISLIKHQPASVLRRLRSKSVGELAFGCERSVRAAQSLEALRQFVLPLEVAVFDSAASWCYGKVRAELAAKGRPIGPLDTLIAAHALSIDSILVTHNLREFRRVKGLLVEDWLGA